MVQRHCLVLLFILCVTQSQGKTIVPKTFLDKEDIFIGGKYYTYYSFSDTISIELEVRGPCELAVITRWLFPSDYDGKQEYSVDVIQDNDHVDIFLLSACPSSKATLRNSKGIKPGLPKKMFFEVSEGIHTYSFFLGKPEGKTALASFVVTRPWRLSWKASLTNTYDDNVYRYSPEDIDNFVYHREDERFSMENRLINRNVVILVAHREDVVVEYHVTGIDFVSVEIDNVFADRPEREREYGQILFLFEHLAPGVVEAGDEVLRLAQDGRARGHCDCNGHLLDD